MSNKTIHLLSTVAGWLLALVYLVVILVASALVLWVVGFYGGLAFRFLRMGFALAMTVFN